MKKAVYIALALLLSISLVSCGHSDADRGDTTKDGTIGDGLKEDIRDVGDDLKDTADDIKDDITGGGNVGTGTQNGSTDANNSATGRTSNNVTGAHAGTSAPTYVGPGLGR